jgi:DNA-binding CsgD family transcriptional regulator/tetratricopeptide (TPR) repeat protein
MSPVRQFPALPLLTPQMVGRDHEIARILDVFKQVEAGQASSVVIRGAGGIGKSRLAEVVLERTESMGAICLKGRASRFDRGIPYSLVNEFLQPLHIEGELVTQSSRDLKTLLEKTSGITTKKSRAREPQDVLGLATSILRELARLSPIVISCDDIHLADADSVALFAMLSRQLSHSRILFIATLRNQAEYQNQDIAHMIEQFQSDDHNQVIDLHPLGKSEIRSMIKGMLSTSPNEDLVTIVEITSNGNPFFAIESTRLLMNSHRIDLSGSIARLVDDAQLPHPETAIIHRFFEIGSADTQVARVLSVFRRISLQLLPLIASLSSLSEDEVTSSFDRLVVAQILIPLGKHEFQFAHSILRDALYDDIGPAEQRRFHRSIANQLMDDRRRGAVVDIAELATHMVESSDPGDPECIQILSEAGHAAGNTAPLVAAQWFGQAASLVQQGTQQWAELLSLQARWLFIASRPSESASIAIEALKVSAAGPSRSRTLADTVNCLYISGNLSSAISIIDDEESSGREVSVSLLAHSGKWDEAIALADDVLWYMDHYRTNISEGLIKAVVADLLLERGDIRQARELLSSVNPPIQTMQFVLANSFDKATIRSGNYKEARQSLEDRVTKSLQSGFGDSMIGALDLLVEVCLLDNDRSAAQKWAGEAEALAQVSHSILRKIVALLCRAEAFESVEAALQAIEIGKQHDLMLYLGRAHLLAGRFGDEPQVHLHAAFQIFEQLQAVPFKQKTAQHMRSRGIAAPRKHIDSDNGLTESETSIAGLVAQGFSNKEIANALHYSIKTVEVYLTRIYQKTNCRSRLDLARAISNGEVILNN